VEIRGRFYVGEQARNRKCVRASSASLTSLIDPRPEPLNEAGQYHPGNHRCYPGVRDQERAGQEACAKEGIPSHAILTVSHRSAKVNCALGYIELMPTLATEPLGGMMYAACPCSPKSSPSISSWALTRSPITILMTNQNTSDTTSV
jgi:hypothetical protein